MTEAPDLERRRHQSNRRPPSFYVLSTVKVAARESKHIHINVHTKVKPFQVLKHKGDMQEAL